MAATSNNNGRSLEYLIVASLARQRAFALTDRAVAAQLRDEQTVNEIDSKRNIIGKSFIYRYSIESEHLFKSFFIEKDFCQRFLACTSPCQNPTNVGISG